MLDGLGLAETTPGPLILVTEFVGFLAAFRQGGGNPWAMGTLGAIVTLWATFAPCFLWIFAGAPYIERLNAEPRLKSALAAVTAAVVGVILNLTVWFGLHVLFASLHEVQRGAFCSSRARPGQPERQGGAARYGRRPPAVRAAPGHPDHLGRLRRAGHRRVRRKLVTHPSSRKPSRRRGYPGPPATEFEPPEVPDRSAARLSARIASSGMTGGIKL